MSSTTSFNFTNNAQEASTSSVIAEPQLAAVLSEASTSATPSSSRNPTDPFFGYTFNASTSESRHDRRISSPDLDLEAGFDSDIAPPPYVEPPEYTKSAEPVTLAKYLFKFGFLFPPFWIMGALILLTPLRAPDADLEDPASPNAWLPEKTEAEKAQIISHLRKAELRWAWRCLWALLVVSFLAVAAGITIWAVVTHRN